jgi:predicted metal-dependent phosphoesterase TrpH
MEPLSALKRAEMVGLDLIAFTEHGIRRPDADIKLLVAQSGVSGLTVIPGEEVACYSRGGKFEGEFLVFGYPVSIGSNKSAKALIELVHGEGGIVIAAHPFKKVKFGEGYYGTGHKTGDLTLDGLEVLHPSYDDEDRAAAIAVMREKGIAGLGSGDAHDIAAVGSYRTRFERTITSLAVLAEEIRQCRLVAVEGPGPGARCTV